MLVCVLSIELSSRCFTTDQSCVQSHTLVACISVCLSLPAVDEDLSARMIQMMLEMFSHTHTHTHTHGIHFCLSLL